VKTTSELNKYIHVEIMGKCWHEKYEVSAFNNCQHCGKFPNHREENPDYCSNRSPRWLLAEVVETVYGQRGVYTDDLRIALLDLHADAIATACVEAYLASK